MQTFYENIEYEVLTPNGFQFFDGLLVTEDKVVIELDDFDLKCTPNHKIKIEDEFICAEELQHKILEEKQPVYDLVNVANGNEYITNDIVSHNCLYIDEICFIPKKMWESFYKSTFPVISASKLAKIMITTTPNGKDHFYYMWRDAISGLNDYNTQKVTWQDVPGRDEKWREAALADLGGDEAAFKQEYEVEFIGASLEYIKLSMLERFEKEARKITPVHVDEKLGLTIFKQPEAGHDYFISVDVSEGKKKDYSTAIVIDVTKIPLEIVATLKNNEIDSITFAPIIHNLGTKYNEAFLIIENNLSDLAKDLWFNYEYSNMFNIDLGKSDARQPRKIEIGIKTTSKVRQIGEVYFKHLVENDKIILNDIRIIRELNNLEYSESRKRFIPRDESINDDLWAALKIFSYVAKTNYFENTLTNGDSAGKLFKDENSDDTSLPFVMKPVIINAGPTEQPKKKKVLDNLEKRWREKNDWF